MAEAAIAPHQRPQLLSLLRRPREMSFLQQSASLQAQSGDSGAIFGILKQMKETFETNMENGKKEEAQAASDYGNLKSTKEEELKASSDKAFTKTEELAKAKQTVSRSQEDLEDTTATLEADNTFLADLKVKCSDINNQWEARQKMRGEEIAAVGETIAILTDDDARDTMNAAGTFVQLREQSKLETLARQKTADHLAAAGKALHSPRLSYLAVRMRNDAFAKVQESIEGMVGQLGVEQQDEVVKKDGCVTDFNTNEKQTTARNEHKEDVETEINDLESEIGAMKEEQAALKQQIADSQVELKKASENREEENKVFQQTVSDQRATQVILKKALDRMSQFYAKKAASSAALIQAQAEALRRQTPPGSFAPLKKNGGGTGVIALLESVIDESKETEADALKGENEAQVAYEDFVKNSNAAIEAMNNGIIDDTEVVAKDTKKEVEDEGDKRATVQDLLKLGEVSGTLHEACDFTVDHFTERQDARAQEVSALKQAETIFSSGR
jgi:predicted  nucleic acid-binding Zn-ribbon protein